MQHNICHKCKKNPVIGSVPRYSIQSKEQCLMCMVQDVVLTWRYLYDHCISRDPFDYNGEEVTIADYETTMHNINGVKTKFYLSNDEIIHAEIKVSDIEI